MFRNVYQRAQGGPPFMMGTWPTREMADNIAAANVSPTLLRIDCVEEEPCRNCGGEGRETYYPGVFGSLSCPGPAERTCNDCEGSGVAYA